MTLTFKKLREGAKIPTAATRLSAGLDLYACIPAPVTINPGESFNFPTGIAVCPGDENVVMLIFVRSGHGVKHCLTLPNSVGVIDSQLVTVPVLFPDPAVADSLPETERGTAGFGSSGRL